MLKDSIIICYSTPNYSELKNIFFDSLHKVGVREEQIVHKLDNVGDSLLKKTGFRSELWYYAVKRKLAFLINTLKKREKYNCKYFLFCDCDLYFIPNNVKEWKNLENLVKNGDYDVYFMKDKYGNDANTGFFIIKNNSQIEKIIAFFEKVHHICDILPNSEMPLGDQTIINHNKQDIFYGYIPDEYVIHGKNIHDKNKSLVHHAIDCRDVKDKVEQINYIKNVFR